MTRAIAQPNVAAEQTQLTEVKKKRGRSPTTKDISEAL